MRKFAILFVSFLLLLAYSCNKSSDDSGNGSPANPELSISRSAIPVGTSSGYTDTFTIKSNISWTIAVSAGAGAWLSTDTVKGGPGTTIVKLKVLTDNTTSSQAATITVAPVGTTAIQPQALTVSQKTYGLIWQYSLGGSASDQAMSMIPSADGGFVMTGLTTSNDGDVSGYHGGGDTWVCKTDATGKKTWQRTLGGSLMDAGWSVVASGDGGCVMAGYAESYYDGDVVGNHGHTDAWVVKLNAGGDTVWQSALGGSGDDQVMNIIATTDGGYVVAGQTFSNDGDVSGNHGASDLWIARLDTKGKKVWTKTFGGSDYDFYGLVAATADGGYLLTGSTNSTDGDAAGNHGSSDILVLKLDANGNKVWTKIFGGTAGEAARAILSTPDGGCAVAGFTSSNDGDVSGNHSSSTTDMWVLKLDNTGKKLWQTTLGGTKDDQAYAITASPDGGYMVAGYSSSKDGDVTVNHGNSDIWVVKLSDNGKKLWQKALGSSGQDWGDYIFATADGGFMVGGFASGNDGDVTGNHGDVDAWMAKIK